MNKEKTTFCSQQNHNFFGKLWASCLDLFCSASGSVMMEYVLMCVLILLGGALAFSQGSVFLCQEIGIQAGSKETADFGVAGSYLVSWCRNLMWMIAQPFP